MDALKSLNFLRSVGGCRKKTDLIAKAMEGNYRKEHVFALKQAYEFFHEQIHSMCNF